MIATKDYIKDLKGTSDVTCLLQELINKAASENEVLVISKGVYLINPIFLESNMEIIFEDGATLMSFHNEEEIKDIKTRVAGIDLDWYPALLNIIDKENVIIRGDGIIDGDGKFFWEKYWGVDTKGGMRKEYDAKGLRFLCDYDCKRLRNVLVQNSKNIILTDFTSKDSGFWNIHILYSQDIKILNVKIEADSLNSPSTDGIDIDSSKNVLIDGVIASCNDDSIAIKSGRDADGILKNIPTKNIEIKNTTILKGFGITLGSELSGGITDINIHDIKFHNTDCGFRIKSSKSRKGYIKNVIFKKIEMKNVKYSIHINLNWNQAYNNIGNLKLDNMAYLKLKQEVPAHLADTSISNVLIENVNSELTPSHEGISRALHIEGSSTNDISKFIIKNAKFQVKEFGTINFINDLKLEDVNFMVLSSYNPKNDEYDTR